MEAGIEVQMRANTDAGSIGHKKPENEIGRKQDPMIPLKR